MAFPLLADLFTIPVWFPSILTLIVCLLIYPKAFNNRIFLWTGVYALILLLYILIDRDITVGIGDITNKKKFLVEMSYLLPAVSIFSILQYKDDTIFIRRITFWALILVYISFVVEYPIMVQYDSVRAALSEAEYNSKGIIGLPGYSLMHAYILLLPSICFLSKMSTGIRKKAISTILVIILCFIIYDTFVTTTLLIMLFVIAFTFLFNGTNTSVRRFIVFGLAAVILWKLGAFTPLIDFVMPFFSGTPVELKMQDFKMESMGLMSINGTITGRENLHLQSWNSFFANPLFGEPNVGGHSSLLDRLGGMGLVVTIPFCMIFISYFKQMVVQFQTYEGKCFFHIGMVSAFILLYEKSMWYGECWLFFMILFPYLILAIETNHDDYSTPLRNHYLS